MNININDIDKDNFLMKEGKYCGRDAVLVNPNHMGCLWDEANLHFRSSVWDKETGLLMSASFPKFFNLGERTDLSPIPENINGYQLLDKIDGSTYIVDICNDQLNVRTRGTFNFQTLDNAKDFQYCIDKYPKIQPWLQFESTLTLLFEITSNSNRIVLDYGMESDITLIGAIDKVNYSMLHQSDLDYISEVIGVKRPKRYEFNSLDELTKSIKEMRGVEGCVMVDTTGQKLIKVKSEEYLKLHYMKTSLNDKGLLDMMESLEYPTQDEFKLYITNEYDFEVYEFLEKRSIKMINSIGQVYTVIGDYIGTFIEFSKLLGWYNVVDHTRVFDQTKRGDIAKFIMTYMKDYSPILFMVVDGKDWENERGLKFIKGKVKELIEDV